LSITKKRESHKNKTHNHTPHTHTQQRWGGEKERKERKERKEKKGEDRRGKEPHSPRVRRGAGSSIGRSSRSAVGSFRN
jgi:hypothetical protein